MRLEWCRFLRAQLPQVLLLLPSPSSLSLLSPPRPCPFPFCSPFILHQSPHLQCRYFTSITGGSNSCSSQIKHRNCIHWPWLSFFSTQVSCHRNKPERNHPSVTLFSPLLFLASKWIKAQGELWQVKSTIRSFSLPLSLSRYPSRAKWLTIQVIEKEDSKWITFGIWWSLGEQLKMG